MTGQTRWARPKPTGGTEDGFKVRLNAKTPSGEECKVPSGAEAVVVSGLKIEVKAGELIDVEVKQGNVAGAVTWGLAP
jgi:hypothetical protein